VGVKPGRMRDKKAILRDGADKVPDRSRHYQDFTGTGAKVARMAESWPNLQPDLVGNQGTES